MINCAWQERSTENNGKGGAALQAASCDAKSAIMQQREIFVAFASHVRERNLRSVESSLERSNSAAQAGKNKTIYLLASGSGFGTEWGLNLCAEILCIRTTNERMVCILTTRQLPCSILKKGYISEIKVI